MESIAAASATDVGIQKMFDPRTYVLGSRTITLIRLKEEIEYTMKIVFWRFWLIDKKTLLKQMKWKKK